MPPIHNADKYAVALIIGMIVGCVFGHNHPHFGLSVFMSIAGAAVGVRLHNWMGDRNG